MLSVSMSVCVCLDVNQGGTTTKWTLIANQRLVQFDLLYGPSRPPNKVWVNRHFQAGEVSQITGCFLILSTWCPSLRSGPLPNVYQTLGWTWKIYSDFESCFLVFNCLLDCNLITPVNISCMVKLDAFDLDLWPWELFSNLEFCCLKLIPTAWFVFPKTTMSAKLLSSNFTVWIKQPHAVSWNVLPNSLEFLIKIFIRLLHVHIYAHIFYSVTSNFDKVMP